MLLTIVWVVGIINAVNIIDIMDGLASGIAVIASLGFLFISLPSRTNLCQFRGRGAGRRFARIYSTTILSQRLQDFHGR